MIACRPPCGTWPPNTTSPDTTTFTTTESLSTPSTPGSSIYNNIWLMVIIAIGVVLLVTWILLTIYWGKKLRIAKETKETEMDDIVRQSAAPSIYRVTHDNINRDLASAELQKSCDFNENNNHDNNIVYSKGSTDQITDC